MWLLLAFIAIPLAVVLKFLPLKVAKIADRRMRGKGSVTCATFSLTLILDVACLGVQRCA